VLFDKYEYRAGIYGHFGQGCIHTRIDFDLKSAQGVRQFRSFVEEAADLVVRYGGSLSGEHGDGQARGELLPKMFGEELVAAFREFKAIWDPRGKMNPGKVVDPHRLDENLRLGADYHPARPATHFAFPEDEGSFALAMERCIGIGECRKLRGGTMCPSYMVTLEEQHSTRGRARMLFEMLRGDPITHGWRAERVKDALDLCLACKGCKSECPANVDMATYKAEFLAHYYRGRRRPRTAYTLGLIFRWSRLAARLPGLVNSLTQTPLLRDAAKAIAGIAPQRRIPVYAAEPFVDWFWRTRPSPPALSQRERGRAGSLPLPLGEGWGEGHRKVILWPDTFNNYFHPQIARAAVEVLEAAGFRVLVPQRSLCCGRPLYDYGRLDLAKRMLGDILDTLRPYLAAGVPVVGLEPSCIAVFRDELINLFPEDDDARRLSRQSFLLGEFLHKQAPDWELPQIRRKALVHIHCHHRSIMGMSADAAVLTRLGLDVRILDSGCCGMAGAFGFEKEHYDLSMRVGERVLLPAVRNAAQDTLIIADGFSCREQIAQGTGRRALHLAEVIHMAMSGSAGYGRKETPA